MRSESESHDAAPSRALSLTSCQQRSASSCDPMIRRRSWSMRASPRADASSVSTTASMRSFSPRFASSPSRGRRGLVSPSQLPRNSESVPTRRAANGKEPGVVPAPSPLSSQGGAHVRGHVGALGREGAVRGHELPCGHIARGRVRPWVLVRGGEGPRTSDKAMVRGETPGATT